MLAAASAKTSRKYRQILMSLWTTSNAVLITGALSGGFLSGESNYTISPKRFSEPVTSRNPVEYSEPNTPRNPAT